MNVELRPEASEDIVAAARFFNEKSDGWGDYFLASIEQDLVDLTAEAGIHCIYNGLPCKFAKTFPFGICNRVERSVAVIYAVLSCRMDPGKHRSILKNRGNPLND